MGILFLSQVLPYPVDAGPKMRSYFVLRHLVQKHQVTLLTFVRDTDRPENIAYLAELCCAVHTVPMQRSRLRDLKFFLQILVSADPFLVVRDQVPAMIAKIQQLVRSETFDVTHAGQLWLAQYALAGQAQVIHYGGQSTKQVVAKMFLRLYEGKVLFFRKHYGWLTTQSYKPILMLAGLARFLISPVAFLKKPPKRQQHLASAGNYRRFMTALLRMQPSNCTSEQRVPPLGNGT